MVKLESLGNGVWAARGARVIDRSGDMRLPVGWDSYASIMNTAVIVDKSSLIADVLDSGYAAILFCRPRRFGKSLNLSMMKTFFELPTVTAQSYACDPFEGTYIWDAAGGRYQKERGAHPVVYITLSTAKGNTWEVTYNAIVDAIAAEYERHEELIASSSLSLAERDYVTRIVSKRGNSGDMMASLATLCRLLYKVTGKSVVLLMDEYDAPVMAGYTNGYYPEAVSFLKSWLTGAVKSGGEAVARSCLTGVQRVTKESVFSDLNNLVVDTPLTTRFDERFGFTEDEVAALASYLGHGDDDSIATARSWYDGYHFGNTDVYNPWSLLNYLDNGCEPDTYWANTSENGVVGTAIAHADGETLEQMYTLLQPHGTVLEPLELGVVFPDVGVREGALWSMLYLSGYLTTEDVRRPNDSVMLRRLRIPNREVRSLFSNEIVRRFRRVAGGPTRLAMLQRALVSGDEAALTQELSRILEGSVSSFDLKSENSLHMLVLGLCFGIEGYGNPISNREFGFGRPDIRIEPDPDVDGRYSPVPGRRPLVTIELKYSKDELADLDALAGSALEQIESRGYDHGALPFGATGRVRWGIAICGKHVSAAYSLLD